MTLFITTHSLMVGKKKPCKTSGIMEEFYLLIFIIDFNSRNTGKEEADRGSSSIDSAVAVVVMIMGL
jgi:uncharacterized protein Veg